LELRILLLILTIFVIFSGCVEENNATQTNESQYQDSANITPENPSSTAQSFNEENIPEIEVTSFSSIYMHDNWKNELKYLFAWDDIPGNESFKLRDYLLNDLEINWARNAKIIKTDDNNTIRVFTPDNSLDLKLSDDKNTVLIKIPNQIQLKVKEKNNSLRVYNVEKHYDGPDFEISRCGYNINKRYYAIYDLSIKNNGSKNLDFKLSELHIRDGDQIFNTTILDPYGFYEGSYLEVLSDFKKENKLEDTILFPGQTINGSVVFQVNSLYNESFLLMYNEIPVPSVSIEKSIEALRTADNYNYSGIFGIPPYNNGYNNGYSNDSFEPDLEPHSLVWPNWINQSIFEFYNNIDSENVEKSSIKEIPETEVVYALKVIPEMDIKLSPGNPFIIVDSTGEELSNTSKKFENFSILKNQTYEFHSIENMDIPQMSFSNATIIKMSYKNQYGWLMANRISVIDQDLILDDKMNIVVARCHRGQFMS
jgi:hypothetical protein